MSTNAFAGLTSTIQSTQTFSLARQSALSALRQYHSPRARNCSSEHSYTPRITQTDTMLTESKIKTPIDTTYINTTFANTPTPRHRQRSSSHIEHFPILDELRDQLTRIMARSRAVQRARNRGDHADILRRKALLNCNVHKLLKSIIAHGAFESASAFSNDLERVVAHNTSMSLCGLSELVQNNFGWHSPLARYFSQT